MVRIAFLSILLSALFTSPPATFADPGSVENGKKVFMERCFQCHGPEGKGDGPASTYLPRKPRNFTLGIYKIKTSKPESYLVRDEDLFNTISKGLVASGMPPWENILTVQERWDLVAYIKSLSDFFDGEPNPAQLDLTGKPPFTPDAVEKGRKAYMRLKCHECHGVDGGGDGIKNLKDDYGVRIRPRDLKKPWVFVGPHTEDALYARLTNGMPLTPMPSYAGRHDDIALKMERWHVVYYLMDLAEKAEQKRARWRTILIGAGLLLILAISPLALGYLRSR